MMRSEPHDDKRPRVERRRQFPRQRPGSSSIHLVLDRDMQPGSAAIPNGQETVKMIGDPIANREQIGTVDPKRNTLFEPPDPGKGGRRPRRIACDHSQQMMKLIAARRRELPKQRDMGGYEMATAPIMHGTQRVEKALVRRPHHCGDNERSGASRPEGRGGIRGT